MPDGNEKTKKENLQTFVSVWISQEIKRSKSASSGDIKIPQFTQFCPGYPQEKEKCRF